MVSGSKGHGVGFESCWTTARNQHARWPTPWRVVFCEKMKNQVGNAKEFPFRQVADRKEWYGGRRLGVERPKWLSQILKQRARQL